MINFCLLHIMAKIKASEHQICVHSGNTRLIPILILVLHALTINGFSTMGEGALTTPAPIPGMHSILFFRLKNSLPSLLNKTL